MLYDTSREKTRKSTKIFFLFIFIAIVVMFMVWIRPWRPPYINYDEFLGLCEDRTIEYQSTYAICCADRNGYTKECSKHGMYEYGGYIAVFVDLQKLAPYSPFHACAFATPLASNVTRGIMINNEEVECTSRYDKRTYRYMFNAGFVNSTGELTILRVYTFPGLGYADVYDYARNMRNSTMILNLTGTVVS